MPRRRDHTWWYYATRMPRQERTRKTPLLMGELSVGHTVIGFHGCQEAGKAGSIAQSSGHQKTQNFEELYH